MKFSITGYSRRNEYPLIAVNASARRVVYPATAIFTAITDAPRVKWQVADGAVWVDIPDETSSTLTVTWLSASDLGVHTYRALTSDSGLYVSSYPVSVTVAEDAATCIRIWTGLTIPPEEIPMLRISAEQRISTDGVACSGIVRSQAIAYLVAAFYTAKDECSQFSSESMGGYSYSRINTTHGDSYWMEMYYHLTRSLTSASALSRQRECRRVDKHLFSLGGGRW